MIAKLGIAGLRERLRGPGVNLQCGPLTFSLRSTLPSLAPALATLYAHHPLGCDNGFADFHVAIERARGPRGWVAPQVDFRFDGERPFKPLPLPQALAMLEWGLNWCVAAHCHQYLIIHAASLARGEHALILPGAPGAGKSTLAAALMLSGWRLLSDELTLIDPATGNLSALARPINLKNASIEVIRDFSRAAIFGPQMPDTLKGRITHLQPTATSVERAATRAKSAWIIFPRYLKGAATELTPAPKTQSFIDLAEQAFNYTTLGETGFDALAALIKHSTTWQLRYSRLPEAIAALDRLAC